MRQDARSGRVLAVALRFRRNCDLGQASMSTRNLVSVPAIQLLAMVGQLEPSKAQVLGRTLEE